MVNTQLFQTLRGKQLPPADALNGAGAPAGAAQCQARPGRPGGVRVGQPVVDGRHAARRQRDAARVGSVKERNPQAKLVCIDIAPYGTTQAPERSDILNVGGFSDDVFKIVAAFAAGQMQAGHWAGEIESIGL